MATQPAWLDDVRKAWGVPGLEEVLPPPMPAVVREGGAGGQAAHQGWEASRPTPEEQVGVVRQEGPRMDRGPSGLGEGPEPRQEGRPSHVIGHDLSAGQPPARYVM